MNRLVSLIVTIMLIGTLVVGCTNGEKASIESPTASQEGGGEVAKDGLDDESKFVKLEMWTGYPLGMPPKDLQLVLDEVNKILKEKINAQLDLKLVDWMGLDSTMNLKINAEDEFDIVFTAPWSNDYFRNVRRDGYVDLTELLPKYAPTIWSTVEQKYWDNIKVDDKIYAVINNQVNARQYTAAFRKSSFEAYLQQPGAKKLEEIKTVEDVTGFLEFAKTLSTDGYVNATMDMTGMSFYWGFDDFGNWKIPGVVKYDDETYKVINQFDTPEWRAAMTFSKQWYDKGFYWPEMAITTPDFTRFHMRFPPTYKPGIETEELVFAGYDTVYAKLGNPILFTSGSIATMNAISATSKNPVRALKLLELLYKDRDLYNLLSFGIEGKHYNVLETLDNGLKRIELIADSGYDMPLAWAFGNQFNQWLLPGQPQDIWEQTKDFDASAARSVTFGFSFDPTPVKTEYAAVTGVVNEYWYNVLIGFNKSAEQIENSYQTFLKRLTIAGADKIIAEKQKQLDEWRAQQSK